MRRSAVVVSRYDLGYIVLKRFVDGGATLCYWARSESYRIAFAYLWDYELCQACNNSHTRLLGELRSSSCEQPRTKNVRPVECHPSLCYAKVT